MLKQQTCIGTADREKGSIKAKNTSPVEKWFVLLPEIQLATTKYSKHVQTIVACKWFTQMLLNVC